MEGVIRGLKIVFFSRNRKEEFSQVLSPFPSQRLLSRTKERNFRKGHRKLETFQTLFFLKILMKLSGNAKEKFKTRLKHLSFAIVLRVLYLRKLWLCRNKNTLFLRLKRRKGCWALRARREISLLFNRGSSLEMIIGARKILWMHLFITK